MSGYLKKFRHYVATQGLVGALLLSAKYPVQRIRYELTDPMRLRRIRSANREYDHRFGVDTYAEQSVAELGVVGSSASQGYKYGPVWEETFRLAMSCVDAPLEDHVFVDIGSGKGKALLLASEYPFQRIVGVELSPALHRIALANTARYTSPTQRCRSIESVCQDAVGFVFPTFPLVVFMFQPFGPQLLGQVLDRLERSLADHPRLCWLIYINPVWANVVRGRPAFGEVATRPWFAVWRHEREDLVGASATAAGVAKGAA